MGNTANPSHYPFNLLPQDKPFSPDLHPGTSSGGAPPLVSRLYFCTNCLFVARKQILDCLGIPMSNAVSMFLRQVVLQKGIPFDVKLPADDPAYYLRRQRYQQTAF